MKICFVHEEYPEETNFGGIATYQKIMAEYFANHGDSVTVIARGEKDLDYYENNVHVFRLGSSNDTNNINSVIKYRKKISTLLQKLQLKKAIDIIETPDWGANTVLFEDFRRVPLVVRLHTPLKIWLEYNNNSFGKAKDQILEWESLMMNKADLLTSCSQLLKDMVGKDYDLKKEIVVIPNPCNLIDFKQKENNKNNNKKNLIYVGSLEERKGVIILAKAINEVFKKNNDIKLYFVGKDTVRNNKNISTKEYILKEIDKKYHNRVIFIGAVKNSEVSKYLKTADLAIFPSLFDNYPYTILEAMATGNTVLISDNIGLCDIVNGNNYIFKSGNVSDLTLKILDFLENNDLSINIENINNVKNECNPDDICNKMKKLYMKTIKEYHNENTR